MRASRIQAIPALGGWRVEKWKCAVKSLACTWGACALGARALNGALAINNVKLGRNLAHLQLEIYGCRFTRDLVHSAILCRLGRYGVISHGLLYTEVYRSPWISSKMV